MASLKIDESVFDKLADVLKKHNLSEVEYKYGDVKIRLASNNFAPQAVMAAQPVMQASQVIEQKEDVKKEVDFASHPGAVKSPMVGTCYRASEPGAQPFVSVGDSVQEGQPLLIIEAMKVMNLIKSPKAGKIIHIAAENSQPVEFGQLLVVIE